MCTAVHEWRKELLAEGTAKGETKFAALVSAMIKGGDAGNVQKAADDSNFRAEMYKKYGFI